MDEQVVRQESEIQSLEEQFVCVRLVQMKGVDLNLFQFDFDQTWAVVFLNADGTVYGRYGTRAGNKSNASTHISIQGLKNVMKRALDIHSDYPNNRSSLAGKQNPKSRFRQPEFIPSLAANAVGPTTAQNCIHCHMVEQHRRGVKYHEGTLTPDDLWVYPLPENIGIKMDVETDLTAVKVFSGSAAAKAGIQPGDVLSSLQNQRLISQADIQWVLHHSPAQARIQATLQRGTETLTTTLQLTGTWKQTDLSWRETSWPLRPGIWTEPLSDEQRRRHRIASDRLGLRIRWVFPRAKMARAAGLRDGDIIVGVDGMQSPMTESGFNTYLRLNHGPGDTTRLDVLRDGEARTVQLQLNEMR